MISTISGLESKLAGYSEEERSRILRAAEVSEYLHEGQVRDSGDPYIVHPLQVSEILIDLNLDADAVSAALLHDVLEDTRMTRAELRSEFGKPVELLVNGVTKIANVKANNKSVQQAETIRKMLFAMVKDIRVILIKLADKLHNMRTLDYKRHGRKHEIAQECLDIYAPLAGRLGISWLKVELEDLSFKHIAPREYARIKEHVSQKKVERAAYLERVQWEIKRAAEEEGLSVTVETRAKHFYSIYEKMQRRGKSVDEIYDLLGIRILCWTTSECYTLLGLVHKLWMPIDGRFKDYIAMPKSNRYQSLHTTVMCYGGRRLEIQIRTYEMHRTAEYGVAAHWLYKDVADSRTNAREELSIINHLRSLGGVRITSNEFLEEIKREILKDSIYVFTPKGDVIQLPRGATPIDFAYHIHTEVGHRCTGAKADGQIVPLKEPLRNTQVVEILTHPNGRPHLSWLRAVRTTRARQKIRHWLNKHDESLILDQSVVARKRQDAPQKGPQIRRRKRRPSTSTPASVSDDSKVGVRIENERNMMIRFANCCAPKTGDNIVGYVSRGRGIIVHRKDCRNLRSISDFEERSVEVEWETISPRVTRRFRVTARIGTNLFSEIEGAVKKYKGHLIEGRLEDNADDKYHARFTMELERTEDIKRVMKSIRAVPTVLNITELDTR